MADDANPGKTLSAFCDTRAMKWRLQKTGTEGIAGAERAVMNAALADLKLPKIELAMVKAHTQTGQTS